MRANNVPIPNPDYRLEELDDELLLYHPAATKTIYLNQTASLVWQLCDGVRTVSEIAELLCESYPDAADTIRADVESAVERFAEHGAVSFKTT